MKANVLVLDDELIKRQDLSKHLRNAGYIVFTAGKLEEANKIIQIENIDFAIIDLKIDYNSDYGGIRAIENINKLQPKTKIIVLSAYAKNAEIQEQLDKVIINGFIPKGGDNYIKSTINSIANLETSLPKKKCFVIMPFSSTNTCSEDEWTDIFENVIKPSVEQPGINYDCIRANLVIGNIIRDILVNLNTADVVIADLTDQNPNVFYELGVRHALRDATILISQNINHVPFDLRHYMTLIYDWKTKKGKEQLKEKIKNVFDEIRINPDSVNVMSPVREYLRLKQFSYENNANS